MPRIGSLNILSEGLSAADLEAKLGVQTQHGLPIGEGPSNPFNWTAPLTNGEILVGKSGADPVLTTIMGAGGIFVTNGPGTITISGAGTGFSWNVVSSSPKQMQSNNGYIATGGGLIVLQLPVSAMIGDALQVVGFGALWRVSIAGGQSIHLLTSLASSSLTSTTQFDTITLVCVSNTNDYVVTATQGNITTL